MPSRLRRQEPATRRDEVVDVDIDGVELSKIVRIEPVAPAVDKGPQNNGVDEILQLTDTLVVSRLDRPSPGARPPAEAVAFCCELHPHPGQLQDHGRAPVRADTVDFSGRRLLGERGRVRAGHHGDDLVPWGSTASSSAADPHNIPWRITRWVERHRHQRRRGRPRAAGPGPARRLHDPPGAGLVGGRAHGRRGRHPALRWSPAPTWPA